MQKPVLPVLLLVFFLEGCVPDHYRVDLPEISEKNLKFPPDYYTEKPLLPSPVLSMTGRELVLIKTNRDVYTWFDATVENGESFDYKRGLFGKGNQLQADQVDFPNLARKGIHSDKELRNTKIITGRSVSRITIDGRPWGSSGVGFLAADETIMSVIFADNQTVKNLGLTHPDLARPLFHLWNISREFKPNTLITSSGESMQLAALLYNGNEVDIKITGSRGWQESIFNDEILGTGHIEMWREMNGDELKFLDMNYSSLTESESKKLKQMLSSIHTGEMVFFYINRYGFYEGHTEYRIDPISVAFIFGLRSISEVHGAADGDLYHYFTTHFTHNPE
jgi:hypothetical protein